MAGSGPAASKAGRGHVDAVEMTSLLVDLMDQHGVSVGISGPVPPTRDRRRRAAPILLWAVSSGTEGMGPMKQLDDLTGEHDSQPTHAAGPRVVAELAAEQHGILMKRALALARQMRRLAELGQHGKADKLAALIDELVGRYVCEGSVLRWTWPDIVIRAACQPRPDERPPHATLRVI